MSPTKTTAPSSGRKALELLDPVLRRARVDDDVAAMDGLLDLLVGLNLWDVDAELDRVVPPLYVTPHPNREQRRKFGLYFDPAEVRRVLIFLATRCRHSKGKFAGHALIPDLWQVVYVLAPVFGWRQADGNRYFRELFLEVPRKNGKSTLAAALALFLLMCDSNLKAGRLFEAGAEVYAAATTTEQAKNVFRPAEAMARSSPALAGRLGIQTDKALVYERTMSRFEVISGNPAKAEEKMGGNVSAAVIDETHVHKDARLIETIESGTAGREQPLVAHLTTAGSDVEGTIYAEKHDLAVAISKGEVSELRTWAVVYTIPDELRDRWDEPEVWKVANPAVGISVSADYLDEKAKKGRLSDRQRLAFLRLHLNVRTSTITRWIDVETYDRSGAFVPVVWPELRARVAYAGLDLSNSLDLSSLCVVIPLWVPDPDDDDFEIEVLEVISRTWTPIDGLVKRGPRERELFSRWMKQGWLLPSPGETIDYDAIEREAAKIADYLDVERLSFDRWGSKQMVNHLRDGGLSVVEMGQGFAGISSAMKATERLIVERRFRAGGNPVLRYAFENLAVEQDAAQNIKPNRAKSSGHVDPAVAAVMAVDGYERARSSVSVYEDRGLATA